MDQQAGGKVVPDVLELIPALRAYARSLCRNAADADDLVQDTLVKALGNIDKFEEGSRLRAWLFTIMRNTFFTSVKIRTREAPAGEDCVSATPISPATQEWYVRGKELMAAVDRLPSHYREMLILVVMLGESYETAAEICDCAIGTVKSRVNRARQMVIEDLGVDAL
ncbi:sigma-70 family RNA polymerase sigma factor [Falsirhodobacter sp. 20TX0035]|uniref:sigma-70 family RNA polymerase sigma factor n=1 Tax=Falsirhodobacter sp. 20TX0035 TaxID=3022019 RepID=UPI00232CB5D4|nr:sigma-70 family RNA polymerase sigma factor [Falsirhodobacter sp. 20TX0035]MDB6452295.1 sigma-70 family RNA polymerase sigma factor [Falsirhodobacter sp. 20TX0035]